MGKYPEVDEKFDKACDLMIEHVNQAREKFLDGGDENTFEELVSHLKTVNNMAANMVIGLMDADALAKENHKRRN